MRMFNGSDLALGPVSLIGGVLRVAVEICRVHYRIALVLMLISIAVSLVFLVGLMISARNVLTAESDRYSTANRLCGLRR